MLEFCLYATFNDVYNTYRARDIGQAYPVVWVVWLGLIFSLFVELGPFFSVVKFAHKTSTTVSRNTDILSRKNVAHSLYSKLKLVA